MVDNLSAFLAIWDQKISKISPTMVDNLSAFLAIWNQKISKFSPTMVDTTLVSVDLLLDRAWKS